MYSSRCSFMILFKNFWKYFRHAEQPQIRESIFVFDTQEDERKLFEEQMQMVIRVVKKCKLKKLSTLNDDICCLCLCDIKEDTTVYECHICHKGCCLYHSDTCDGFLLYISNDGTTCPTCRTNL